MLQRYFAFHISSPPVFLLNKTFPHLFTSTAEIKKKGVLISLYNGYTQRPFEVVLLLSYAGRDNTLIPYDCSLFVMKDGNSEVQRRQRHLRYKWETSLCNYDNCRCSFNSKLVLLLRLPLSKLSLRFQHIQSSWVPVIVYEFTQI
jgi:hypothetical protein